MVGTAGGGAAEAVRRWVEAGGGHLVLDGGLATELEANGADLNDPLWSAKCLLVSPRLIRKASRFTWCSTFFGDSFDLLSSVLGGKNKARGDAAVLQKSNRFPFVCPKIGHKINN